MYVGVSHGRRASSPGSSGLWMSRWLSGRRGGRKRAAGSPRDAADPVDPDGTVSRTARVLRPKTVQDPVRWSGTVAELRDGRRKEGSIGTGLHGV